MCSDLNPKLVQFRWAIDQRVQLWWSGNDFRVQWRVWLQRDGMQKSGCSGKHRSIYYSIHINHDFTSTLDPRSVFSLLKNPSSWSNPGSGWVLIKAQKWNKRFLQAKVCPLSAGVYYSVRWLFIEIYLSSNYARLTILRPLINFSQ